MQNMYFQRREGLNTTGMGRITDAIAEPLHGPLPKPRVERTLDALKMHHLPNDGQMCYPRLVIKAVVHSCINALFPFIEWLKILL